MKHPIPAFSIAGILAFGFLLASARPGQPQPNIVFILADDLGYGDLSSYGAPDIRTPHLDQMAGEGVRFTDYYANGSTCSPTRAAFMTGRYQQRLGLDNALYYQEMGRGLDPGELSLADDLKSRGYVTGLSGKWHLGYDKERTPLQQGFDHFFGLLGGNHHYFEHMDRIGVHDLWQGNEPIEREGHTTDLISGDSMDFMRRNRDRPFFLFISHAAPHFPWQGPDDRNKEVKPRQKSWQSGDRATYAAMVEHMDAGIGKTLAEIDRLGLREKTLVVFSSDNGGHTYSNNKPLSGEKATLWEGGIRVPCIARWPGVLEAGTVYSEPCITMDWTATFRRLAGLQADPAREEGIDLLPYLTGKGTPPVRSFFWRRKSGPGRKADNPGRAVRQGDWKYLEMDSGERFLFNLKQDISESRNRIEELPQLAVNLSESIKDWEAMVR